VRTYQKKEKTHKSLQKNKLGDIIAL